jgi:hypothetical protein
MPQEADSRPALLSQTFPSDPAVDWQDLDIEPSLEEILADPIVHLVLGRDHLEIRDVERFLKCASRRLIERDRSPNFGRVTLRTACTSAPTGL